MGALVLVGVVVLLALSGVQLYNGLVSRRNEYRNAFSQIDVQLRRRHDLIPNLVEVAKGYLKHERETLQAVTLARAQATAASQVAAASPGDPRAMRSLATTEAALTGALSRLLVVAEAYPEIKANQTMARLMDDFASTENRVSFARQAYNDAVMTYNVARESFPGVLVARPFGFSEAAAYEVASEAERQAVKVSFA